MSLCAICTSARGPFTQQPLGKGDALVSVCGDCDEPVIVRGDNWRGYQAQGGLLTPQQSSDGVRKALGADFERIMDLDENIGRAPVPSQYTDGDDDFFDFINESYRRHRAGSWVAGRRGGAK